MRIKPSFIRSFLLYLFLFAAHQGMAQQKPLASAKDHLRNFYRQTLQLDSVKAEQVAQIQDSYKADMKLAMGDSLLTVEGRRNKFQTLMEQKNQQLRKILSPAQQEKMIPHSERALPPVKKD